MDVGKVVVGGLVADFDVDFFLGVGVIGNLVVFAACKTGFLEQIAREDMVDVAQVADQLAYRNVLGEQAGVVGTHLRSHEHPEVGPTGAGGFQLLH